MKAGTPLPEVVEVTPVGDSTLKLRFKDGLEGTVDLGDLIRHGDAFAELRDPSYFQRVSVDREIQTIVWPNGVSMAPEGLHAEVLAGQETSAAPARDSG